MILYRYLNRQILMTTLVVTAVLVMVLVSGRFIKYLADAAAGEIPAEALFWVMGLRLPEFLQMILPLSLFIAMMLVIGRLYSDNEMAVIQACGVGQSRIIRGLFAPILSSMVIVGLFSLYVTPFGDAKVARIFEEQEQRSALELLTPGRFHVRSEDRGQRATYAQGLDREAGRLNGVFISELRELSGGLVEPVNVRARSGEVVEQDGELFLKLEDGIQYRGVPGQASFSELRFSEALLHIERPAVSDDDEELKGLPTLDLLARDDAQARAELQWRVSLVIMVPLVMLAAVPLGRVSPRGGRFVRFIPALAGFLFYMGLLLVMRSQITDFRSDSLPVWMHMGWIHLLVFLLIAALYQEHDIGWWWRRGRREKQA